MFSRKGKTNINDIFTHILTNFGVPQNIRCKKTKIVGFSYKIDVINYVFACDPNDVNQISFKEIKVLCEKKQYSIQKSNIHPISDTNESEIF